MVATHPATKTQIGVTWKKGLDGHEPLIRFSVSSRCFRALSGT